MDSSEVFKCDENLLFWSNDERNVEPRIVQGKCFVRAEKNITSTSQEWTNEGELRFYYSQMYNKGPMLKNFL